jgi:sodium-dependent dicarboxylate transporter 2/3/5
VSEAALTGSSAGIARVRIPLLVAGVVAGLTLALGARLGLIDPPADLSREGLIVAGVMIVMATSWILEGLPLAATALLPMVLLPLLGAMAGKTVAKAYMSSIIMLLLGGFMLAKGLERWGVPERVAHLVSRWASGSPVRLLAGLMATTAFMSMWLSNTATTLIMVTVALAAATGAERSEQNAPDDVFRFKIALALGIAYAANVGGLMTPVGTAPNALLLSLSQKLMPEREPIPFFDWMVLSAPVVIVLVPTIFFLLHKVLLPFPKDLHLEDDDEVEVPRLGPGGRRALVIFGITALLWVWRKDINLGFATLPGWSGLLGLSKHVDDGVVAMLGCILMFAFPAGGPPPPGEQRPRLARSALGLAAWLDYTVREERVLSWEQARKIPWYLVLLFGGGLALADAFASSGLSAWLGDQLVWLKGAPPIVLVLVLCLGMSLLTEVTSNTATTTLVLPVMFAAAAPLGVDPLMLMWPATICASAAFILPISTPPNAIAAGAANIAPLQMARVGAVVNLIAVVLVSVVTMVWVVPRLGL